MLNTAATARRPAPPRLVLSVALALAVWAPTTGAGQSPADRSSRESVVIQPYNGPPIYLPAQEPPPPPARVKSEVIRQPFPDSEVTRFERTVVTLSDNSTQSDGPAKEFYSDGQLFSEGAYASGLPTGEWVYYHQNGQVAKRVTFDRGKPTGEVELLNDQGKRIAKRSYVDGLRDGVWETYDPDGEQKLREESYQRGVRNGVARTWYRGGPLRQEVSYRDGKREGVATEWTRLGEKRAEVTYRDDKREGSATVWQSDGRVLNQVYEDGKLVSSEETLAP